MLPKQNTTKDLLVCLYHMLGYTQIIREGDPLYCPKVLLGLAIIGESTSDTVLTSCSSLSPAGSLLLFVSRHGWLQTNPRLVSPTSNVIAIHRYCTRILHFLYCLLAFIMEQKFWTSVNKQDTGCVNCSYLLHKCNELYSSIMLFLISFQILMLYIVDI